MQSFEKINPHSLLDTALSTIRSKILSGELEIGEFFPPEKLQQRIHVPDIHIHRS